MFVIMPFCFPAQRYKPAQEGCLLPSGSSCIEKGEDKDAAGKKAAAAMRMIV